jgi:hypothetical protein
MERIVEVLKDRICCLQHTICEFVQANENLQEDITENKKSILLRENEIADLHAAIQRLEA